jgi:lipoate-protein ligase A
VAAGCDLETGGRKLVGSAQARHAGVLLQQNSLPLRLSHDLKAELFGAEAEDEERLATDLAHVTGRDPSVAQVQDALVAGFRAELGVVFEQAEVVPQVAAAAQQWRAAAAL